MLAVAVSSSGVRADGPAAPPASPAPDAPTFATSKLTGNWWGARDTLASKGVELDVSLTQFYQGVTRGGIDTGFDYGGKLDSYLRFDGSKAGLVPGLSITAHLETRYGQDINNDDGMLAFGNFNMAFPTANESATGLTALKLTQTFGDHFMLIAGKINTLDDFRLNFTGFNGLERFMNSAMVANIINARTIPYSTYGGGFSVFSNEGPQFLFLARDPDNHPTTADLDKLFARGVVLSASLRMPVTPMGLRGTQVIGGNWSSRDYTSLEPTAWTNPPGQGTPAPQESGSWALYYNFDQYLWISSSNADRNVGIFGMFGLSDGNPNFVRWNATVGVGGSGLIPGRKYDTCGLGYFYLGLSEQFKDLLAGPTAPPGVAQRDEQGVELYYNVAIAPWCHLTADLQVVEPSTRATDMTVLAGARLKIDF
ncbi:MAG TPA: carbohydrate porin [Humisphaera sp.]|jgi:porin|nr:carbohydrate porin [Humisphaera sp.]